MNSTPQTKTYPATAQATGISEAGRRFGHRAARAAIHPTLSRIVEQCSETSGVRGGEVDTSAEKSLNEKVYALVQKTLESKFAMAAVVFLLTAILLCAINPPMAQKPQENPTLPPTRSPQKILMWSTLASLVTLLLPYGMCLVKKNE